MHVWKLERMRMEPKWGYCDYRLVDIYSKLEVRSVCRLYDKYLLYLERLDPASI